jgi:hypothetical protein
MNSININKRIILNLVKLLNDKVITIAYYDYDGNYESDNYNKEYYNERLNIENKLELTMELLYKQINKRIKKLRKIFKRNNKITESIKTRKIEELNEEMGIKITQEIEEMRRIKSEYITIYQDLINNMEERKNKKVSNVNNIQIENNGKPENLKYILFLLA